MSFKYKMGGKGETLYSVHYERLTALLIEAVKELSTQNDELKARIVKLENP